MPCNQNPLVSLLIYLHHSVIFFLLLSESAPAAHFYEPIMLSVEGLVSSLVRVLIQLNFLSFPTAHFHFLQPSDPLQNQRHLPISCSPPTFPRSFFQRLTSSSGFSSNRPSLEIARGLNAPPAARGYPCDNYERKQKR